MSSESPTVISEFLEPTDAATFSWDVDGFIRIDQCIFLDSGSFRIEISLDEFFFDIEITPTRPYFNYDHWHRE